MNDERKTRMKEADDELIAIFVTSVKTVKRRSMK